MDQNKPEWRDEEITVDRVIYEIAGGAILVLLGLLIGAQLFENDNGYGTNLFTEAISITLTIVVLDRLAMRREDRRQKQLEIEKLTRYLRSGIEETRKRAFQELFELGWIRDGSLNQKNFYYADFSCTPLFYAKFSGTSLTAAVFINADLTHAQFLGARLERADFSKAKLWFTNFHRSDLTNARFNGAEFFQTDFSQAKLSDIDFVAEFVKCDFRGTDFSGVRFIGVTLKDCLFDTNTILPDGSRWSPNINWRKYGGIIELTEGVIA